MNQNITPAEPTVINKTEFSVNESMKRSRQRRLAAALAPLYEMRHAGLAFLFPVLIMALIYIAMEVWPFGNNSVLVLDLNGQYVYYFEALRDILRGEQGILYSFERALGG